MSDREQVEHWVRNPDGSEFPVETAEEADSYAGLPGYKAVKRRYVDTGEASTEGERDVV